MFTIFVSFRRRCRSNEHIQRTLNGFDLWGRSLQPMEFYRPSDFSWRPSLKPAAYDFARIANGISVISGRLKWTSATSV